MAQLLTFKRFSTAEQASQVITILQEHHIPVQYEQDVVLLDKVYVGQNFDPPHMVKIPADYFAQADALLKKQITISLEDVEPDYYLLSFTTEELRDVIIKKDEWGDYDYLLAMTLLEKQGITFSESQLEELRSSRLETLAQPVDLPVIWQVIGFCSPFLALTVMIPFAWIFSFLGIFIGAFVRMSKKTLPDGTRRYAFSPKTRNTGTWMILSSIVLLVACWTLVIRSIRG